MKKLFITVLLFIGILACASGQEIIYRDIAYASWNVPASPIPLDGERWEYEVYLSNVTLGDPTLLDYSDFVYVGRALTEALTIDMSLYQRLAYYLIVRSVFIRADGTESLGERADSLHDADPTLFPLGFWYVPAEGILERPRDLRDSGM